MTKFLPFLPIPLSIARGMYSVFKYPAFSMAKAMPKLKENLSLAELAIDAKEYIAAAMFAGLLMSVLVFVAAFFLGMITAPTNVAFATALVMASVIYVAVFGYALAYPKLLITRRIKLLERDLFFALKYVLIRLKSGVPLYDAMVGVAHSDYGEVSKEFKKAVKEIATGIEDVVALENMAARAPSPFFRRTIWQLTNNMRAGSDVVQILDAITSTMVKEQRILIRKYGSELNPIILLYMMFAVIVPSLGVTVLIVMSSFSGLELPVYIFYIIPVAVFIAQVFFTRLVKDKKPMLSF
jgi:pilus assembly protein TadC